VCLIWAGRCTRRETNSRVAAGSEWFWPSWPGFCLPLQRRRLVVVITSCSPSTKPDSTMPVIRLWFPGTSRFPAPDPIARNGLLCRPVLLCPRQSARTSGSARSNSLAPSPLRQTSPGPTTNPSCPSITPTPSITLPVRSIPEPLPVKRSRGKTGVHRERACLRSCCIPVWRPKASGRLAPARKSMRRATATPARDPCTDVPFQ
jgi:hypothetical protein